LWVVLLRSIAKRDNHHPNDMVNDHPEDTLPEEYVAQHSDELIQVVRQSSDPWIRGLCLAALIKYGNRDYDYKQLRSEIDEIKERVNDE
jgi:hypothetical protein